MVLDRDVSTGCPPGSELDEYPGMGLPHRGSEEDWCPPCRDPKSSKRHKSGGSSMRRRERRTKDSERNVG